MRLPAGLRETLRGVAVALALAALAACAAPATNGDAGKDAAPASGTESTADMPAAAPAHAAPATQATPTVPQKPMRTGGPLPADPIEPPASKPGIVDTSCSTDADCTVKNVGNCCGYAPACVNRDSPTDPEGVKAECAKKGMASVCGFQEISSCSCKQGRCESVSAQVVQ